MAPAVILGTTAISTAGSIMSSMAQSGAMRQNAAIAQQTGAYDAAQAQKEGEITRGAAIANYGAAGVDPTTGSPMMVNMDLARQTALAADMARWKGNVQASFDNSQAKAEQTSGILSASSSLLGGALKFAQSMKANGGDFFGLNFGTPSFNSGAGS